MATHTIVGMDARFATEQQSTELTIHEGEDGVFAVSGVYRNVLNQGFPGNETTERTGLAYRVDVEGLANAVLATTEESWYHHYVSEATGLYGQVEGWWYVRVTYADGIVRRWEGFDDAPKGIDRVYGLLVSFGMPALHYAHGTGFADISRSWIRDSELCRLTCYEKLLGEALALEREVGSAGETPAVVQEFVEDVRRFLREEAPGLDVRTTLATWGVSPTPRGLCRAAIGDAPRSELFALFGALADGDDTQEAIAEVVATGALARWCARLRRVPAEERASRDAERRVQQEALMHTIDDKVRERIAAGKVFTSYEVASEMGVTAQQASTRIRRFVRNGDLKPVGDGYPRRYKAA